MHGYIFPYSHWVFSFLVCQDWRGVLFPLSGRADIFFYSSVYGGLSSIVFNFLLIPLWGIWGAVLSVVLSFMVMSVSRVAYSWTYVKLTHIPLCLLMLLLTCIYSFSMFDRVARIVLLQVLLR